MAIDRFGTLPENHEGNQRVGTLTERLSKLTRAEPKTEINWKEIAKKILDSRVTPYGIPLNILNDNGLQFVGKFFTTTCNILV